MERNIIFLLISVLCCPVSCDFLEFDETSETDKEENVYNYFVNIKRVLTSVYTYMPYDLGTVNGAMRDCGCDDAEYADISGNVQIYNNGRWSPLRTVDAQWKLYNGIREANLFLEKLKDVNLSRYESVPAYQNQKVQLETFPYQARLLRAFYFFELARRYGDIPLPLELLDSEKANNIEEVTFDHVIDFIVRECDECAAKLPETYRIPELANETGRVTKGFAMALKSKALLYAASPLHNEDGDIEKWKKSALAAYDLIASGLYKLAGCGVTPNNVSSVELVLARMMGPNSTFELQNFPLRFTYGSRKGQLATGNFPTQNLVDAFETINGYAVALTEDGWKSDDPAFNPAKPFADRDPRFYQTVLADGSTFKGKEIIDVSVGGADDDAIPMGGSATGYFLKKYIQPSTSFVVGKPVSNKHTWVIYRYAEALLAYAESMIEAFDNPDFKDAQFALSAREALNMVRRNAGMPDVTVTGKEPFLEKVRKEWRVEFAFEDHRFWDVRRWKIGANTQKDIWGIRVMKNEKVKSYQRVKVETRVWDEKMNLYPVPKQELVINPNLSQNPGW